MNPSIASDKQQKLPLTFRLKDETPVGAIKEDTPVKLSENMNRVLDRENLFRALRQVKRNKGAPGIDGMTVNELPKYLKEHWLEIKASIINGTYKPSPVKRIEIPKPNGGKRMLGIPTVLDRFIQQAIGQILQDLWEPVFSHFSFGFRPERSARHAILWARHYIHKGYKWVVDMDLEKFFDQVNHDLLMQKIKEKVSDTLLLSLINKFLKSGAEVHGNFVPSMKGVPQGGPLSPLLSNIMLNELDWELTKRGHLFVRYADDCNIYVKSKRAGERVLINIESFIVNRLRLKVNREKSAVDRPWKRTFLGFTFTRSGRTPARIKVSDKAIKALKEKVREITSRTRGIKMQDIIFELSLTLSGWKEYFKLAEVKTAFKELDKWIRRRLRCVQLKQWGRSGYKELKKRGISTRLAWNTAKSAHGPWRLSQSPAVVMALPLNHWVSLGLVLLFTPDNET